MNNLRKISSIVPLYKVQAWTDQRRKVDYIREMYDQRRFCKRTIAQRYSKIRDWCDYLEDLSGPPTLAPTSSSFLTTSAVKANRTLVEIPNDTKSYLKASLPTLNASRVVLGGVTGTSAGYGFAGRHGCYDDFNCDTADLANLNHYLMGIFALAICVIGVLANTLCIPSFNIHANRSSATFYMTAIAVCDALVLILCTLVYVMKNVPTDYLSQQSVYKTFSGYLVPSAMPTLELCELMSFWIVIALLFDRFFYLKNGFQSKAACSRSLCAKVILAIFGCLVIYTAPKFLQYKVVEFKVQSQKGVKALASAGKISTQEKPNTNVRYEVEVMLTMISSSDGYRNVMTHWLKVPVEMFLPLLILSGLTGYFLFKVVENRGAWYGQIKRNRHTPPAISNPLRTIVTERQVRQENVNILIALAVGLLVFVCKMPKFVAHVLVSETNKISPGFIIAVRFLDVLCAALKPALYLGVGDHLHRGIFGMFCSSCRAHEESAANEIALQMELTMTNNVIVAAAANHVATENGSAGGRTSPEEYQPLNPTGETGAGSTERNEDTVEQGAAGGPSGDDLEVSVTTSPKRQTESKDVNNTTRC